MQNEQSAQLIASRRTLSRLVKQFNLNRRVLDESDLKELKRILKNNPDIIEHIFTDILKYFRQNDCEYRLATLQLCNELFQRSHVFRVRLISHLQEILLYTAETDPIHYPSPPPKETARILKLETLKLVKLWHEKYAEAYPRLNFAVNFLRCSKSLDFENASAQLQAERQRTEEEDRKKDERGKKIVQEVELEFRERQNEILCYVSETQRALELLVPRFDVDEDVDGESCLRHEIETIHACSMFESVAVTVPLNAPVVNVNAENKVIIDTLVDCMRMLQFCKKIICRWLSKLTKYGGKSAQQLCKEVVDLKEKISVELSKCEELNLQNIQKSDSEVDDFEDVPEKEGLELDYKSPEELPQYILQKTMQKMEDMPKSTGAGYNMISGMQSLCNSQDHKKYESHENKNIPVFSYGLDLKYWGENDVRPAEIPRNNADCHRFWRPSDEGCSTSLDIEEAYHARVMTFIGQPLKGSRQCRTPLSDGTLCPRMDLKRCPLHGKIIDRDEMGYPLTEIHQKSDKLENNAKEDEEYIMDVEAATGINLRGKMKRRKKKKIVSSNAPGAVRERLSAKLFDRSTIKRVYETLESIRKAKAAKNFEHQFNYALEKI